MKYSTGVNEQPGLFAPCQEEKDMRPIGPSNKCDNCAEHIRSAATSDKRYHKRFTQEFKAGNRSHCSHCGNPYTEAERLELAAIAGA